MEIEAARPAGKAGYSLFAIRTRTLIEQADIVTVRFGEKYKQWNAAFDAGYAAALGKPIIVTHQAERQHALKEVDAVAWRWRRRRNRWSRCCAT